MRLPRQSRSRLSECRRRNFRLHLLPLHFLFRCVSLEEELENESATGSHDRIRSKVSRVRLVDVLASRRSRWSRILDRQCLPTDASFRGRSSSPHLLRRSRSSNLNIRFPLLTFPLNTENGSIQVRHPRTPSCLPICHSHRPLLSSHRRDFDIRCRPNQRADQTRSRRRSNHHHRLLSRHHHVAVESGRVRRVG